jgi:uncharacterized protein
MQILMTGGTGFIGQALCTELIHRGHQLCILTRRASVALTNLPQGVRFISDFNEIASDEVFDAVINLAGEPIARRWTDKVKTQLLASRVGVTKRLVTTLKRLNTPPRVLISGSAIGYYGPGGDVEITESSPFVQSFSHELCEAWEKAALKAKKKGIRVCCIRTGVVLGSHGGVLEKLRLAYLMGMGGPIGSGKQWLSWVHLDDLIRILLFCLENEHIEGPVNATAPFPVQQSFFAKTYGGVLRRPAFLPMPPLTVRLLFGQMGEELMLDGQKVIPSKLLENHFEFRYPTLQSALQNIESSQS